MMKGLDAIVVFAIVVFALAGCGDDVDLPEDAGVVPWCSDDVRRGAYTCNRAGICELNGMTCRRDTRQKVPRLFRDAGVDAP